MATYGIHVKNDAQDFVIDGVAKNPLFVAKGVVTTNESGVGLDFSAASVSIAGLRSPIIATSSAAGSYGIVYSDGTAKVIGRGAIGAVSVNYWIFDTLGTTPPALSWGLRIRNPDTKEIVYQSGQKSMQVLDFFAYSRGDSTVRTYSGKTLAYVNVGIAGDGTGHPAGGGGGLGSYVEMRSCIAISGAVASIVSGTQRDQPIPSGTPMPPNFIIQGNALILDVTGY